MNPGRILVLIPLTVGCVENPFAVPEPPCDERVAYYPDDDGDGVGDPSGEVYITCDDPGEGWTRTPHPEDTDVSDTDVSDTDVGDTDG